MALAARLTRLAWLLLLAGLVGLVWAGWRWQQAVEYNRRLALADYAQAARFPGPRGRLAEAYRLAEDDQFQQAVRAYGALRQQTPPGHPLRRRINYNLATLYLRRGLALMAAEQPDLAIPLIELAKASYRALLRDDSADWQAKYNLERALDALPDSTDDDPAAESNPERSSRAAVSQRSQRELP